MLGVIVNVVAIAIGGIIGVLFKKILNEKLASNVMVALGVVTFIIGIKEALKYEKTLVFVLSIAIGTLIGNIIDIDKYVNRLGEFLKKTFVRNDKGDSRFAEAFASTSILFAVGAMSVLGSINSGLKNDHSILFLKATLDGVASIMYASTLGIGVVFSALTILIFQGSIALLAGNLTFLLEDPSMMNEFSSVGNLLVMIIGLNLMGVTKIKVANMLPAIVVVIIIYKLTINIL